MKTLQCKYCPEQPASYFCDNCNIGFCITCVPQDNRYFEPRCTLCRQHLNSINSHKVVAAFWTEWLYFLRIPLSPGIFSSLLIYSFIGLLLPNEGSAAIVIGGIYLGLLIMMLFELSNLLAEGRTDTPTLHEIWSKGEPFLLVRFLLQVLFVLALIVSINKDWFTISLIIIYGLGFPASIIILALEKRFFSAMNPLRIFYVISAIGAPYLLLYGSWLLVMFISFKLFQFQQTSHFIYTIVSLQVSYCLWTAWFSMIGYAVYQYHQQLGIAVEIRHKHQRQQQLRSKAEKVKSAAIKEAEILIAEQRFDDAMNLLSSAVMQPMVEMDVHRFYLKLLVQRNETKRLNNVSKHLVRQFISQQKYSEAINVATIIMDLLPDWYPDSAGDSYIIAQGLARMGRRDFALTLLVRLMSGDYEAEFMAKVSFEAAKLMAENFNRDTDAIECLQRILTDYPNQTINNEVEIYLGILKSSGSDNNDNDGDGLIIN